MFSLEKLSQLWQRYIHFYDRTKSDLFEKIAEYFWVTVQFAISAFALGLRNYVDLQGRVFNLVYDLRKSSRVPRVLTFSVIGFALFISFINWALLTVLVSVAALIGAFLGLRRSKATLWEWAFVWSGLFLFIAFVPFIADEYRVYQLTQLGGFILICFGLNIVMGYSGQISFGHAAFALCGAYFTGYISSLNLGIPVPLCAIAGGIAASLMGGLVSLPSIRVKGPYLGLITWGLAIIFPKLLKSQYLTPYTGGFDGIPISQLEPPQWFFEIEQSTWAFYSVSMTTLLFIAIGTILLQKHRFGRALAYISLGEEMSKAMGINVFKYKMMAFALSAFYAGLGGGLLGSLLGLVTPNSFSDIDAISYMTAIAVGGLGSILGSFLGGVFLSYQSEVSRILVSIIPNGESLQWTLFGGILVLFMVFLPEGIAGELRRIVNYFTFHFPTRYRNYRNPPQPTEKQELFDDELFR